MKIRESIFLTLIFTIVGLICFPYARSFATGIDEGSAGQNMLSKSEIQQLRKDAEHDLLACALLIATTVEPQRLRDNEFRDLAMAYLSEPVKNVSMASRVVHLIGDTARRQRMLEYLNILNRASLPSQHTNEQTEQLSPEQLRRQFARESYDSVRRQTERSGQYGPIEKEMLLGQQVTRLVKEGNLEAALESALKMSRMFNSDDLVNIGLEYYRRGDHDRGLEIINMIKDPYAKIKSYRAVVKLDPETYDKFLNEALKLIKDKTTVLPLFDQTTLKMGETAEMCAEHGDKKKAGELLVNAVQHYVDNDALGNQFVCSDLKYVNEISNRYGITFDEKMSETLKKILIKYYSKKAIAIKKMFDPSIYLLLFSIFSVPAAIILIFGTFHFADARSGAIIQGWLLSILLVTGVLWLHRLTGASRWLYVLPLALTPVVFNPLLEKAMRFYKIKRGVPKGSDYWICPKCANENGNLILECLQCGYNKNSENDN